MRRILATACCALVTGGLLLTAAGCGNSPEDGYETLSPAEAEQIEQARRERAQTRQDESPPDQAQQSPADLTGSPLVLAAAQTAAAAARQSEATDAPPAAQSPPPTAATPDPAAEPSSASSPEGAAAASAAGPDPVATSEADSPLEVAATRAASAVQAEPIVRTIQLLVPERSFTVEGPDDAIRISYDDFDLLKVLNMEPVPVNAVDHFPEWLKNLDGKQVRLRGFMYPTFQETDIPAFVLARDNQICCFGRNPKIYDLVEVTLADGVTTDYIQGRPFDVVGRFHIRPETDGDELWQLYQMTDAVVIQN